MKILGIGNAIVDVICKVEENFLTNNGLTKGTMKLNYSINCTNKLQYSAFTNMKITGKVKPKM